MNARFSASNDIIFWSQKLVWQKEIQEFENRISQNDESWENRKISKVSKSIQNINSTFAASSDIVSGPKQFIREKFEFENLNSEFHRNDYNWEATNKSQIWELLPNINASSPKTIRLN